MSGVYLMCSEGNTSQMERIRCKDEDKELQRVLRLNPNLLPGDQIKPEDPRRWLLIKREMPVPDPNSGVDRWNIDFMYSDQDAVPTFVECKRYTDTRSRREVVGQMLEYAANGHHYWTGDLMEEYARASAKEDGHELEALLADLQGGSSLSTEAYFAQMESNLRLGQLRIIFFLEESSMELRSVVDFLNKQMERTEVLLVEAKQYRAGQTRIVVPTLFGYTEEARLVKKVVTMSSAGTRRRWDRNGYFADAGKRLSSEEALVLEHFLEHMIALGSEISWGTGSQTGSYSVKFPKLCPRSLLSVFSNGRIQLNLGYLPDELRSRFRASVTKWSELALPPDTGEQYPSYPIGEWQPYEEALVTAVQHVVNTGQGDADI